MDSLKRFAVLAAVLAATFAAATPGVGAAEPQARAESAPAVGPSQIRNQGTGRCMGMPAGDDRMRVWNCTTEAYQLWDLVPDGRGRYHMVTRSGAGAARTSRRW
ncbi:RICIN domain-containing protein [Streptomyces sp. HUAS TT7]|uniref:RICIN domain-containing protein n=1 Tax=Streptomyces sp. HUAS TT7 TaxID=3447507 RepID=UPI003F658D17